MRVLLVEDNASFANDIEKAIRTIPDCELVWERSRDGALARLEAEPFDLVILDRRIPSADDVLDDHQDHGWRVFQDVRGKRSGTPLWFLTGTEDVDFPTEMNNEYGRLEDILGREAPEQMYRVFWKRSISTCITQLRVFSGHSGDLDRIAIRFVDEAIELNPEEYRILKIFGRKYNGTAIDLTSLNGGLSPSRVLKVVVRNAENAPIIAAAAKVSPLLDIMDEAERYRDYIARLTPGGFPQLTVKINSGAGNCGGLFYGMVGDASSVQGLFRKIASNDDRLAEVARDLRTIEGPWYDARNVTNVQVGTIRRKLIGDAALHKVRDQLDEIDIGRVEACSVTAATCAQHGDLHCANVVFDGTGRAMLIDFGDAGPAYAALDPVTLELSTVFHSQRASLPAGWPTEGAMREWVAVERYTEECSFGAFIAACRTWAIGVAGSQAEVVAIAYAYAIRQLKYHDTDKNLARALIRACIADLVGGDR